MRIDDLMHQARALREHVRRGGSSGAWFWSKGFSRVVRLRIVELSASVAAEDAAYRRDDEGLRRLVRTLRQAAGDDA